MPASLIHRALARPSSLPPPEPARLQRFFSFRNVVNYKVFTFIILFLSGCAKDDEQFRDSVLGNWFFKVVVDEHNTDSIGFHYHDTLFYVGTIAKGNAINELKVNYLKNSSALVAVAADGTIVSFPTTTCSGSFSSNTCLKLFIRSGGLGGFTQHQIVGNKMP